MSKRTRSSAITKFTMLPAGMASAASVIVRIGRWRMPARIAASSAEWVRATYRISTPSGGSPSPRWRTTIGRPLTVRPDAARFSS
jgi:hypothetical protein